MTGIDWNAVKPQSKPKGTGIDWGSIAPQLENIPPDTNDDMFGIGNMFSYLRNATPKALSAIAQTLDPYHNYTQQQLDYSRETGNILAKNIGKFFKSGLDFSNPRQQISDITAQVDQAANTFQSNLQNKGIGGTIAETVGGAVKGLTSFLTVPIGVLTQTHDENGVAVPSTPQQQAENIQKLAGMAAQAYTVGKITDMMAPALKGEAALTPSKIGILAKNIGASTAANAAGGFAQGMVSGMGQDDQIAKSLGDLVSFAPLGVLFGTLRAKTQLKEVGTERATILNKSVENAQELAQTKALQTTNNSSVEDVISNVDALASSDNLATAFVKSKLNVGQAAIIEDLSEERTNQLRDELSPSTRMSEGAYKPSDKVQRILNMSRPNLGGVRGILVPNFADPFDKAVYLAGGNGKSAPIIMEDLVNSTGLTEPEILSHRANIKEFIKNNAPNVPANVGTLDIPKQNFDGQMGRTPYAYNVYRSDGGTTMMTPWKLNQPTQEFFEKTGYMPNEVVSLNGAPHIVRGIDELENLTTREKVKASLDNVTRDNTNINSEMYKDQSGNQIGRAGVLNRDNYFSNMYDAFKQKFILDEVPNDSYANEIIKFAKSFGISNKGDIEGIQKGFYSKIQEEVQNGMPENEAITNVKSQLEKWSETFRKETGTKLSQALQGNGMYIVSRGGGRYDIRDISSQTTLQNVGSAEEAYKFVTKSGLTNGLDLDGGDTNGTPTAPASLGSLADPYSYQTNKWAKRFDIWNTGGLSKYLVGVGKQLASIDATTGTDFTTHVNAMQRVKGIMKYLGGTKYKGLESDYNDIQDLAKGLPEDRLHLITDNLETKSPKEILNTFLDRKMNGFEAFKAGELSKLDVDNVVDFMHQVTSNIDGDIGGNEFLGKMNEVASKVDASGNLVYDPKEVQAADELFKMTQFSDKANPLAIVRLAQALKFPDQALTRADHAARYDLTANEIKIVNRLDRLFEKTKEVTGLNPQDAIDIHLNNAKIADALGMDVYDNKDFQSQFAKQSYDLNGSLIRNPLLLARNFLYSATRTEPIAPLVDVYPNLYGRNIDPTQKVSFNEVVKNAEKYNANLLKDGKADPAHAATFAEHVADIKGIPDLSEQLGTAAQKALSDMLGKTLSKSPQGIRAINLLANVSYLGGRLALPLRDITNGMQNIYNTYGAKFAARVLGNSISADYANALYAAGDIPSQSGLELLNPGETIHNGVDRLAKAADFGQRMNGARLAHQQLSVGIYKATMEQVADLSGDMLKNEISKADAYKELKIGQIDPTNAKLFDDYITAGNTIGAAKLLAKYRVKSAVNIFGNNNSPLAWSSSWGRLAGTFMSWGTNQIQTLVDGTLRGSRGDRLAYGLRWGASNAAILGAGYAAGVNLNRWMISPFDLVGNSPILGAYDATRQTLTDLTNPNVASRQKAQQALYDFVPHNDKTIAHMWIPYSQMMQGIVDSYNQANQNYGPVAGMTALGFKAIDTRSPLQKNAGYTPYKIDRNRNRTYLKNKDETSFEK